MLLVRSKQVWQQMMDDKFAAMANLIPGIPRYVLPGTAAGQLAFVRNRHTYVYTDINSAYADCVDGQGDAIVLLPGAHTLTAALAWSKANVSMWGPEAWMGKDVRKSEAVVTAAAAAKGITITGANAKIFGGAYVPVTTKSFFDFSVLANGLRIHNAFVDLNTPAVNVGTKGIVATGAASDVHITGCTIVSGGAQGPAIDTTALVDSYVEDCLIYNIAGSWAVGLQCGAGCKGLFIRRCYFSSVGTAMTVGIDLTGADQVGGIEIADNRFHSLVTGAIKNSANNNRATITENFQGSVGAGAGGALVTVII